MRRPRRPAQDLRFTVDCLPRRTRVAMVEGIRENSIIVGAYTDRDGGVCPMLAAHRCGGRTDLASFAHAWDRYTHAGSKARQATPRELLTLSSMLEASLEHDDSVRDEFAAAVAELEAAKARRATEASVVEPFDEDAATPELARDTGERDRSRELQLRPGWSWLRVFRRYDEYEAALERVRAAEHTVEERELDRELDDRELERV